MPPRQVRINTHTLPTSPCRTFRRHIRISLSDDISTILDSIPSQCVDVPHADGVSLSGGCRDAPDYLDLCLGLAAKLQLQIGTHTYTPRFLLKPHHISSPNPLTALDHLPCLAFTFPLCLCCLCGCVGPLNPYALDYPICTTDNQAHKNTRAQVLDHHQTQTIA